MYSRNEKTIMVHSSKVTSCGSVHVFPTARTPKAIFRRDLMNVVCSPQNRINGDRGHKHLNIIMSNNAYV